MISMYATNVREDCFISTFGYILVSLMENVNAFYTHTQYDSVFTVPHNTMNYSQGKKYVWQSHIIIMGDNKGKQDLAQ